MPKTRVELWAGVECTVNRVDDRTFNQLRRCGHDAREDDLERFASLGVKALRYPVLWELFQPEEGGAVDWGWAERRLGRLRALGVRPIVGFLHHGSGPRYTDLTDPRFPELLARYARAFAERFPWVAEYTPVNEPNTTARFSGLYGVWYPHARSNAAYARMVWTQCRAIALAMREVRRVNPAARLVQTDDLGTVSSTAGVRDQAEYENERRWASFDLLCGRVTPGHTLYEDLCAGVGEAALARAAEEPCPPDVLGLNYYVTSDRFLDERLADYPPQLHGGNGRAAYVDIESVRVAEGAPAGHEAVLRAAWERYGLPVAITEVHLDATREEQMRWLDEAWRAARAAETAGMNVRAVTAWALLGSYDWNSLVTREDGYYEPGVYDLRTSSPRETALAGMLRELAAQGEASHPVLAGKGWWRRPCRVLRPACPEDDDAPPAHARPVLITGGRGTLGRAFARACRSRGLAHRLLTREEMDIASPASIAGALRRWDPWLVVNAAGYVKVDAAERERAECFRDNTTGAENLARAAAAQGSRFVTFSTDMVFDGSSDRPYVESDPVAPLNVYGLSKALAEMRVLRACADALVVRTSSFFGPWDDYNFLTVSLRKWFAGEPVEAAGDVFMTATYVPDLVRVCLDLAIDGERGIWHVSNPETVSWAGLATRLAELTGFPGELIQIRDSASLGAMRPRRSALGSERGVLMPSLEESLKRYLRDLEGDWLAHGRSAGAGCALEMR